MTVNGPMMLLHPLAILEEAKAQFRRVGNLEAVGELGRGCLILLNIRLLRLPTGADFCEFFFAACRLFFGVVGLGRWRKIRERNAGLGGSSLQSVRMNFIPPSRQPWLSCGTDPAIREMPAEDGKEQEAPKRPRLARPARIGSCAWVGEPATHLRFRLAVGAACGRRSHSGGPGGPGLATSATTTTLMTDQNCEQPAA